MFLTVFVLQFSKHLPTWFSEVNKPITKDYEERLTEIITNPKFIKRLDVFESLQIKLTIIRINPITKKHILYKYFII